MKSYPQCHDWKESARQSILSVVAVLMFGACWLLPQSPYRVALPDTASEILEHRSGTVDFVYLLRAKVTRAEFEDYVGELGLQPTPATVGSDGEAQLGEDEPDWWMPIGSADELFELHSEGDVITAWYKDGFLYLSVTHL